MKYFYFTLIAAIFTNLVTANHIPLDKIRQKDSLYHKYSETITSCGDDSDLIRIDSFQLTPDPPLKGKPLRIEATGFLKKDVDEGSYLTISIKYGFIPFSTQKLNICDEAKQIDRNCPLRKGPLTISKETDIPSFIPWGKYTIDVNLFTASGERLTCLHGNLKFPGPFGK